MSYTKQNFFKGQTLTADALNAMDTQIEQNATQIEKKVSLPVDKDGNVLTGRAGQMLISKGDGTTEWLEPEEQAPEGSLPFEKTADILQQKPIAGTKLRCTSIIAPTTTGVTSIKLTRCGKNLVNEPDRELSATFPARTWNMSHLASPTINLVGHMEWTIQGTFTAVNIRTHGKGGASFLQGSEIVASASDDAPDTPVETTGVSTVKLAGWGTSEITELYFSTRSIYKDAHSKYAFRNVQIEIGTQATEFEPYQGDEYTINLGRTVYGGTFNWHTGELTITHELVGGVVTEKETPQVVNLTPQTIYAIATTSGINTVYSDCGDTLVSGYVSGGTVGEIINSETIVTLKYQDKRLLALGDSITNAGKYLTALQKYVPFKAIDNQGIGGATMLRRGQDSDCCVLIDTLETSVMNADVITIAYGTNDSGYLAGAYQIGELKPSGTEFEKGTFYGAYQYTIEKILTWKPTVKIIPVVPAYAMTTGDKTTKDNMAQAIRNIANFYGFEYVDWYHKSGMNSFNVSNYTGDGLHHNDLFSDLAAKKFIPILLY